VLEQLRFELRFDDLQLPQQQVIIEGDRDQLEVLHEAVSNYMQNLLNRSPEQFNAVLSALALLSPHPQTELRVILHPSEKRHQILNSAHASAHLVDSATPKRRPLHIWEIFLQPGSGLAHNLFGVLATQESGPVIHLSMLQLFDLQPWMNMLLM